jgi:hypothetical protein
MRLIFQTSLATPFDEKSVEAKVGDIG